MYLLLSVIRNPPPEDSTAGSSSWQLVFISIAVCLIMVEVVRGWRLGIMRQLMRVAAVTSGYAAAYFGSGLLVPYLRSFLELPDIVISAICGVILAMVVYGIIAAVGTI